jgi:ribonuclease-3 family protein
MMGGVTKASVQSTNDLPLTDSIKGKMVPRGNFNALAAIILLLSTSCSTLSFTSICFKSLVARNEHRGWHVRTTRSANVGGQGDGTFRPFSLLDPEMKLLDESEVRLLSPIQLSFVGDAVYELHSRTLFTWPAMKPSDHRGLAVTSVRAETQAVLLRRLLNSDWPMTLNERSVLRKGRNASGPGPQRLVGGVYGEASALEAVIGYLYLSDRSRLQYLLDTLVFLRKDGKFQVGDDGPIQWSAQGDENETT